ncbi:hypothetical protein MLD38_015552 [Melastoma candidum]|uniref:Uncharacterized protein n=1 Tax=Melastoma candidum TaxID=119954 RepID=A0ACB9RH31_9MYRT|nr:hypothetical protein MLD38_015552 [Melastoma candidum]
MRSGEDRGGCMWRLVSKLHSHGGGSTQRLLSGGKHCKETAAGYEISRLNPDLMTRHGANVSDGERTKLMAMGSKASVKTLMEEEMIIEADTEWINSLKRGKQRCDRVIDDDDKSSCSWSDEQSFSDDVREITEYLGGISQKRSGTWEERHQRYEEEKFSRALRKALSRQLANGRRLSEEEMLRCSKVFMNMLGILNSAEFSLLELLRDPEAMFTKCMEILRETQLGRIPSESLAASSISPRKEEGSPLQMNVGSPLVPSKIVILKPWMVELPKPAEPLNPSISRETNSIGTKGHRKKSVGPGFLSDIKRKLKNIVTKEYAVESADNIDKKWRKRRDGRRSSEKQPSSRSLEDKPFSRSSARRNKYLSEAMTVGDKDRNSSSRDPETMSMILLRPELNCFHGMNPGSRWEYGVADPLKGSSSKIKSRILSDKWRKRDFSRVAETDIYAFKFLAENISPASSGDGAGIKVTPDSTEESSLGIASSSGRLILEKDNEDMETSSELPERPSPVSVLEPHFSEDDVSPEIFGRGVNVKNLCLTAGFPRQHLEIELEEDEDISVDKADAREGIFEEDSGLVLDRVAALLGTLDLTWEDLYLKSQSTGQLFEPSLHCDSHLFKDNGKFLIDCVNEVLSETCARLVGHSCLPFAGQRIKPAPSADFIVHEVCQGVKWHLDPIPHPHSLEQIIGKGMSREGSWMDLTSVGESIAFEFGDAIFSELLEEITDQIGIR